MKKDISAKQIFEFIYKLIRPFWFNILIMISIAIIWAILISIRPYILKIMLNKIVRVSREDIFFDLSAPALAYLFVSLLYPTIFRIYSYFIDIKMIPILRQRIALLSYDFLLNQSYSYYQHQFSGSLASKINDLTIGIPNLLQSVIDRFFGHTLALIIAIYTLWLVNIIFAVIVLIWAILFIVGGIFITNRIIPLSDIWSEWGSVVMGKMVDSISNILSVRLFARESVEKSFLKETLSKKVKAEEKLQWSYFWLWLTYGNTFFILLTLNLYFLIKGRQEGWVTVGDFALVLTLNISILDFFWKLTQEISLFSQYFGKVKQALRSFMIPPEIKDLPNARNLLVTKGEIIFDSVRFNYKGSEPLFQNKSVTITPHQKVGLVGYSGSGKSTFVNLILRLYEVGSGHIMIDGQDIRNVTQNSLHEAIGMIPQEATLFHRTLRENILYGRIEATDEEVKEAAKSAHAHEFIVTLPHGYESLVGERGVKLSGGQRQRIAIARAILKNAPILILDEATTQIDSITENLIKESLWKLMKGKTTIIIAHRLSTLLHMDRILVFDQGKIVGDGTHKELLIEGGLYKQLWEAQVGGFLQDK